MLALSVVQNINCIRLDDNSEFMLIVTTPFLLQLSPIEDKGETINIIIYLVCLIIQLYIPCYFASQLTARSQELSGSIFHSKWWTQSKRFKSSLVIFAERAARPIEPKAGALFMVGLPIFVKVIYAKNNFIIIYFDFFKF